MVCACRKAAEAAQVWGSSESTVRSCRQLTLQRRRRQQLLKKCPHHLAQPREQARIDILFAMCAWVGLVVTPCGGREPSLQQEALDIETLQQQ